jgi:hypothetical protein
MIGDHDVNRIGGSAARHVTSGAVRRGQRGSGGAAGRAAQGIRRPRRAGRHWAAADESEETRADGREAHRPEHLAPADERLDVERKPLVEDRLVGVGEHATLEARQEHRSWAAWHRDVRDGRHRNLQVVERSERSPGRLRIL